MKQLPERVGGAGIVRGVSSQRGVGCIATVVLELKVFCQGPSRGATWLRSKSHCGKK